LSDKVHNEKKYVADRFAQVLGLLEKEHQVLLSYEGELTKEEITRIESHVEEIVAGLSIPKGPLKKIFFISVETLQNMLIHGHRNGDGHQASFFILSRHGDNMHITSANLVGVHSIPALEKQIEVINSFDDEKALKAYYLEHLENNQLSEKGGAGLGFITIGMKSGNKLVMSFEPINGEFSMFLLTSTVSLL